jgi:hypothetical protein
MPHWSSTWALPLLIIVFITLWSDIGKESFEPSPRSLVMRVFDDFQSQNVHLAKGSIVSVRLEDVQVGTPEKQSVVSQLAQGKKAFVARASGKPKLILSQGGIIVDKRIYIEAQGETREDTVTSAKKAIDTIGTALAAEAKFRGLLAGK